MANRRRFIQSSLIVSAASLAELVAKPSVFASQEFDQSILDPSVFDNFIVDTRFDEAIHFAKLAKENGLPLSEFSGDLTNLWCQSLSRQWKGGAKTVAGVTERSGLFVLETLAADYGMRVSSRSELAIYPETKTKKAQTTYFWVMTPRSSTVLT